MTPFRATRWPDRRSSRNRRSAWLSRRSSLELGEADLLPLVHAFGIVRVGANARRIAGPLIGAAAALVSLPLVFAAAGGLLAGALLAGLALIPRDVPSRPGDDPEPEVPPGTLRALVTDRRLAVLVLAGGLLSIAFAWWEADGLVLLRQQHPLSTTGYAILFTIAAAAIVAFQIPVTRRTVRVSAGLAMLTGAVLQGAGLATLVFARYGYPVLVIAVLLMAAGEMTYAPTVSAFVTTRAGRHRRASYQAALSITGDIGTAIGPISGLALAAATSAATLWAAGAILSALAGTGTGLAAAPGSGPPGGGKSLLADISGWHSQGQVAQRPAEG